MFYEKVIIGTQEDEINDKRLCSMS